MNSAVDLTREFPFSAEHFRVITDRIYRFSGIKLPEGKREMVYARLARRLRSLGLASFDDYVRYLEAEPSEWEHCTNALTTNVTSFFREEHHFRVLAEHAQARAGTGGAYRVWSAGCSTGEEPYSIAMTLADTLRAGNYRIVASDLDTQVLATARQAVYPLGTVLKLPEARQKRFFLRGAGRTDCSLRVSTTTASHSELALVYLMEAQWAVDPRFDAIFCRTVMLYF